MGKLSFEDKIQEEHLNPTLQVYENLWCIAGVFFSCNHSEEKKIYRLSSMPSMQTKSIICEAHTKTYNEDPLKRRLINNLTDLLISSILDDPQVF